MRRIVSVLSAIGLLVVAVLGGEAFGSSLSSAPTVYRLVREDTTTVRGLLEEIGRGFITVQGFSYKTASDVKVKGLQGEVISGGVKGLTRYAMIELVLEGNLVVQIQVVGLPR